MSDQSKIEERRQRAREAYWDADGGDRYASCEAAIETATRVKITDEAIALSVGAIPEQIFSEALREALRFNLAAALAELGFEVES